RRVLNILDSSRPSRIIQIIDACRTETSWEHKAGPRRWTSRGKRAPVTSIYAASAGEQSLDRADDRDKNSPRRRVNNTEEKELSPFARYFTSALEKTGNLQAAFDEAKPKVEAFARKRNMRQTPEFIPNYRSGEERDGIFLHPELTTKPEKDPQPDPQGNKKTLVSLGRTPSYSQFPASCLLNHAPLNEALEHRAQNWPVGHKEAGHKCIVNAFLNAYGVLEVVDIEERRGRPGGIKVNRAISGSIVKEGMFLHTVRLPRGTTDRSGRPFSTIDDAISVIGEYFHPKTTSYAVWRDQTTNARMPQKFPTR
ncbi:MAG: hypothetical protein AAGF45_11830, partial [Pseudomonadota bacterium]